MQTRLRTGSLQRSRQQSIDTDDGRHRMGSLDFSGISDDAGAQLVAGLKDSHTTEDSTTTRMTTRRSAARAIPIPNAGGNANGVAQGGATTTTGLSHTPPTVSNSYENQHFGKRPRAGSVSGRLRSASDLEDKGLIDRNQKQILKDLIISGDEELQAALDKYEKGDTADLEALLRSGEFVSRHAADIDLLGDLDLDFLNVDDHFGDLPAAEPAAAGAAAARGAGKHIPPNMISDDDGITNLDLHGGEEDYLQLGAASRHGMETRLRSNSLAYGPLLNDHAQDSNQVQYGRWMDREVPQTREGRVGSVASSSADAPAGVGGLAESLAQYAKSKGEPKPLTKAQLAEQKRRERQEKKEQKEREKQEKKAQRERARAEKKERDAREKKEKKKKKAAASKTTKPKKDKPKPKPKKEEEEEEPKVILSGTGRPRSMSDPNLSVSTDEFGLMAVDRPDGWVGAYSPESRKIRIDRFMAKRNNRVWTKKVKYDVRKNFADSRLRVKGRFVKKEDELLMRDLISLT